MKASKAFILFLVLLPVIASAESDYNSYRRAYRAIEGIPTVQYGGPFDATVKGGTLLMNPGGVAGDKTWEKSKNIIVSSLRQISMKFEDGTGMAWGEGSENWVFHIDDSLRKSRGLPDVGPAQARGFAELPTSKPGDDRFFVWGMLTLSSVNGRDSELKKAFFTDVVFHKDSKGGLILGVATPNDAEMYVPPVIISLTPFLVSSLVDGKGIIDLDRLPNIALPKGLTSYPSSTDIAISEEGDGSFVAKGRFEFLLLGWGRLYRNYGEGAKVRIINVLKTPIELVDGQNQVTRVTSGAYVFSNGKWTKCE